MPEEELLGPIGRKQVSATRDVQRQIVEDIIPNAIKEIQVPRAPHDSVWRKCSCSKRAVPCSTTTATAAMVMIPRTRSRRICRLLSPASITCAARSSREELVPHNGMSPNTVQVVRITSALPRLVYRAAAETLTQD